MSVFPAETANSIRPGKRDVTVTAFQHLPHCYFGLCLLSPGL